MTHLTPKASPVVAVETSPPAWPSKLRRDCHRRCQRKGARPNGSKQPGEGLRTRDEHTEANSETAVTTIARLQIRIQCEGQLPGFALRGSTILPGSLKVRSKTPR